MASNERLHILEMIDQGQITPEQGIQLLKALDSDALPEQATPVSEIIETPLAESTSSSMEEVFTPQPEEAPSQPDSPKSATLPDSSRLAYFRRFWLIPLVVGTCILVLSAAWMYLAWQSGGVGFWFACSWFPFLIGVAVLALAWASRSAPWLHVRVHQKPGEHPEKIAISFPIPVGLVGWILTLFKDKIPDVHGANPAEMVNLLKHTSPDRPLYVQVNEKDGEHVEVYIG